MKSIGNTKPLARLENVTVVTAEGKRYDLGRPGTLRFKIKHALYKRQRKAS